MLPSQVVLLAADPGCSGSGYSSCCAGSTATGAAGSADADVGSFAALCAVASGALGSMAADPELASGMGCLQATSMKIDPKRLKLWRQYREGLILQVKVERPELIVDKQLFFVRVNQ